ncbi:MAG: hypothetical protein OEW08_03895 [Gammaproteobacteria bacterium]|nr:hypothetical protein [Gammaproteobacteria bacterium]
MQRGNQINLMVGLLLVAVAFIAWWQPGVDRPTTPMPTRLTQVTPEQVSHINISRRGQAALELVKDANFWSLKLGARTLPVASWRVENILRLLVSESGAQWPVTPTDLPQFDLAPPLMQLTFNSTVVALGGLETLSSRRYALANGTLHLIEDKLYRQLMLDPMELVDLQLLPGKPSLQSVNFGRWRVALDEQGAWRVIGIVMQTSADTATAFIDEWRYAEGLEVRTLDPKLKASNTATVTLADGHAIYFKWTRGAHDAWMMREDLGLMYRLPLDVLQRLTDFSPHLSAQNR